MIFWNRVSLAINSNIPDMNSMLQHKNYIVEDGETGQKYNWLKNQKI